MSQRDELNALLLDARAKGLRVFCCFGCGDWFIQQAGPGRRRRACDDPWCLRMFRYWKKYGRLPSFDASKRLRETLDYLHHKPVKTLFEWRDAA